MFIKQILIYFPLVLIIFLAQSFFWVPTYDKQAVGNPERLKKYIRGSSGDAEILNPVISADTASSSINSLVFDGLIALDDKLEYRPRLATSWTQTEEVFLVVDPRYRLEKIKNRLPSSADWVDYIKTLLEKNQQGIKNIKAIELVPGKVIQGSIQVPILGSDGLPEVSQGRPRMEPIFYALRSPDRIKFTLNHIDQDFFNPIKKWIGEEYFEKFPYDDFISAKKKSQYNLLKTNFAKILPLTEHNPIISFNLRRGVRFHDGHEFDSGDVLFTYRSIMNVKTEEEFTYTILGVHDSDPANGIISFKSPMGKELLSREVGDEIEVNGSEYEITKIVAKKLQ